MSGPDAAAPGPGNLEIVLTGGGARAAYHVGFVRWVARNIPGTHFPIITGVSAGAINATFLAVCPDRKVDAIERLCKLWSELTVDRLSGSICGRSSATSPAGDSAWSLAAAR